MIETAYLVDGCRTPIGSAHPEKGAFRHVRADELTVRVLQALRVRMNFDPADIDDFYLGCVGQHLEQGKNLARLSLLLAGWPNTVPANTINRLCGSSFSAVQFAADAIRSGRISLALAGGVEHMTHVPITAALDYHTDLFMNSDFQWTNMGLTAEKLAVDYDISRTEQDQFTIESNDRYFSALEREFYDDEVIPVETPDGMVTRDQQPRQSTLEKLATLKTPFKEDGTVTAANASGIGDGAAMTLIASGVEVEKRGLKPLAKIIDGVSVGLNPEVMGLGPVPAIQKLLERNQLSLEQIDAFEINEAFAVQVMACLRDLDLTMNKVNMHGGAVALGHPLGMSGARIILTLARTLAHIDGHLGIASMCVGHGQGVAMLLERV